MQRSLVLGGGGAKIGWASGALEVLLDEAHLEFDHIDATSGSVFNLAMLLSGRSAHDVAEAWSELAPQEFISFHRPLWKYLTFWRLPSLLTQDAAVRRILPKWGIDLAKIRACRSVNGHPMEATFNVLDFGTKRIKTIPHTEMDQDYLLAVDAVPGVVPPVAKDDTLYTDAMLLMDANLQEAVRRGADEIWVLWTVEDRLQWRGGFIGHFGHIFEICAVGNLKRDLDAIEEANQRVAAGTARPGERHVTVHLLRPEKPVPVDYLFFLRKGQLAPTVESGRADARRYLAGQGIDATRGTNGNPPEGADGRRRPGRVREMASIASVARYALGGVRLVMGSTALLAPTTMIRRLQVRPEDQPSAAYAWRLFGVRTVLLAGELLLLEPGPRRSFAVRLAPLIHASDLTAAFLAGRNGSLPASAARTAVTVSGINTALALLAQLDDPNAGR